MSTSSQCLVKLATCNLNQWALDFDGNLERIKESIKQAKSLNCRYRLGPELEICGYGCEDHFLETDTYLHSWECLAEIITADKGELTKDILCDIGMPIIHRDVAYNCRVYVLNRRILGIRPKLFLANDGNYRETRWFTEWKGNDIEDFHLPESFLTSILGVSDQIHPKTVSIGIIVLRLNDTVIGSETCEELFTPDSPHISMSLDGVEIITNGSGSHHQLRKLSQRVDLMKSATAKSGGIYLYSNQLGCDGGRCFYDGCSMIWQNGNLVSQGSQFGMSEVEVVTGVVNLSDVHSFRTAFKSRSNQAADRLAKKYPRVNVDFTLSDYSSGSDQKSQTVFLKKSHYIPITIHDPMEEIAYGPSTWLWDYLRRSNQRGYFLPLSGGMDSSSTALMVGIMCDRLYKEIKGDDSTKKNVNNETVTSTSEKGSPTPSRSPKRFANNSRLVATAAKSAWSTGGKTSADSSCDGSTSGDSPEAAVHNSIKLKNSNRILQELRKIIRNPQFEPRSGQHICEQLFFTCYMASQYSGQETRRRAKEVSRLIGANHTSIMIDDITSAVQSTFSTMQIHDFGEKAIKNPSCLKPKRPQILGATGVENIALQNIQARSRMVMSYFLAQLLPWQIAPKGSKEEQSPGTLLVLGSANVDEAIRGYYTKYDCSAADINPIGGIKKVDLKSFLLWGHENYSKRLSQQLLLQYAEGSSGDSASSDIPSKALTVLRDTAVAEPSAELTGAEGDQKDEVDMGMSYEELGDLGNARKLDKSGPLSTYERMVHTWGGNGVSQPPKRLTPSKRLNLESHEFSSFNAEVGQKVKDFYFYNAINRHKMTTLTPAYHAENYSPEDNRFDLRPFLYPAGFSRQFRAIDREVKKAEECGNAIIRAKSARA